MATPCPLYTSTELTYIIFTQAPSLPIMEKQEKSRQDKRPTAREIVIASALCGLCTGIFCSILWLAFSGVNWLGFFAIGLAFLLNACLGGLIAMFIHSKFSRTPISLAIYIGNALPLGLYLLCSFFAADASTEAWFLIFLVGWLIISVIPAVMASSVIRK